ncbi:amidase [Rubrimonas cliftonensis]|uniref:Aspartyl/glutamyl-tRNA(Asn/Gln) amidotransferase subunit A n=1 Tax=Rubrimonas cliftonensis TaxID=89524 RepID=A0A1H4EAP1_9RHOB|nr:amidase [Rubrimonas cliftonensis]SEA82114.1 aspartyl/glutamyl-tRNA(Asn/Gln) amidotransferase subunit A [Rubrimonas cliftonensis]
MTAPAATVEEAVARVASGESRAALARTHLDALEAAGAALNAVARLERDAALARAAELDAAARDGRPSAGPLDGAPLAHKDLYARAGWRLEAGSSILAGNVASDTATACARLDTAGALDLGRLNTVEFALGAEGLNAHTGPVRNPWNPAHVTGGSSSGSAAAVAFGAVPAALGSDTGGSIRLPAAACGLIGLKPTAGLVGRSGVFPLSGSLDTVGPLTRTVRDAALMLNALACFDAGDPQSARRAPRDHLAGVEDGLRGLRIGVPRGYFFAPLAPAVEDAHEAALRLLEAEGAALVPVETPGIETANRLTMLIIAVEAAAQHAPWLAARAADYGPVTRRRLCAGLFQDAGAYLRALGRRASLLRAILSETFADIDLLYAPTWTIEIPTIAEAEAAAGGSSPMIEDLGHCSRPVNFLGLPAVTAPCGLTPNGLPAAFQLIGRPFAEPTLLRAARGFERARRFLEDHAPALRAGAV